MQGWRATPETASTVLDEASVFERQGLLAPANIGNVGVAPNEALYTDRKAATLFCSSVRVAPSAAGHLYLRLKGFARSFSMPTTAIIPPAFESDYLDWHMSPGLACGGFVFLTGLTGSRPDGSFSTIPEAQIREAFRNVEKVLDHGGLSFSSVVEMTTYHLNLQEHIELFRRIRDEFVVEPYPAWTAIEVLGLVEKGALVEIRVIAHQRGPEVV